MLSAIEVTTRHSFFAELIDDKTDLPNAIALNSVNINATQLIGPALGGLAIAWMGEALCFGLNAVSLPGRGGAIAAHRPRANSAQPSHEPFLEGLAQGWRHAWNSPWCGRWCWLSARSVSPSIRIQC